MLMALQEYKKLQIEVPWLSHRDTLELLFLSVYRVFDWNIGEEEVEQSSKAKMLSSWKEKGASQSRPKPLLGWVQEHVDMEGSEMYMTWLM